LVELLVADGMIERKQLTRKFTIYSVTNYDKYNPLQTQSNKGTEPLPQPTENPQKTHEKPTDNPQTTTIKTAKTVKKDNTLPSEPKKRTIVDDYHDLFQKKYNNKPIINGKVAAILHGIVNEIGMEDALRRLRLFFQDDSEYVTNSFHAIAMFRARINQYVSTAPQQSKIPDDFWKGHLK
jgi:hypothetical protein